MKIVCHLDDKGSNTVKHYAALKGRHRQCSQSDVYLFVRSIPIVKEINFQHTIFLGKGIHNQVDCTRLEPCPMCVHDINRKTPPLR